MSAEQMHSNAIPAPAEAPVTVKRFAPCEECERPFEVTRRWQRFCGTPCRNEWHRKKALGPEGRMRDLEAQARENRADIDALKRTVAELERRVASIDDPVRR